jgi:hypothetical protein
MGHLENKPVRTKQNIYSLRIMVNLNKFGTQI